MQLQTGPSSAASPSVAPRCPKGKVQTPPTPRGLPTPPPPLGAALQSWADGSYSYLGPFPSVFFHFPWEVRDPPPLSGDRPLTVTAVPPHRSPSKRTSLCIRIARLPRLSPPRTDGKPACFGRAGSGCFLRGGIGSPRTRPGLAWAPPTHVPGERIHAFSGVGWAGGAAPGRGQARPPGGARGARTPRGPAREEPRPNPGATRREPLRPGRTCSGRGLGPRRRPPLAQP